MSMFGGVLGITQKRRPRLRAVAAQYVLGIAGLALITFVCFQLGFHVGRTAFVYLILVVPLSLLGSVSASVVLSIIATACLNFFFTAPLFEFRIDAADDVVRVAMFLTTSLIVTVLTTRLKRAEQELGENNARLEEAQRGAHFGWWERDLITGRVTVSDEVGRILGMEPVAPWLELIYPEDRARVADAAAAAVQPGGPRYDAEYRVMRPDGAAASRPQPGRCDPGRLGTTSAPVWRSARHHGAEAGGARATRERGALPYLGGPRIRCVLSYNEDGTVLDVNRQACESLGYRRDELIGMTAFDYGPDLTPALLQRIRERLQGGKIVTYDGRHRRKDGTEFPVEVRIRALWREGQLLAVSLDRDITGRKGLFKKSGETWVYGTFLNRGRDGGGEGKRRRGCIPGRLGEERRRNGRRMSCARARSAFAPSSNSPSTFTGRAMRSIALSARSLPKALLTRRRQTPRSVRPDGKCRTWSLTPEAWRKHRETLDAHLPFRDFELARPAPDGSKRYVSVSGLPVFDKSERFIGYRGVGAAHHRAQEGRE